MAVSFAGPKQSSSMAKSANSWRDLVGNTSSWSASCIHRLTMLPNTSMTKIAALWFKGMEFTLEMNASKPFPILKNENLRVS